MIINIWVPWKIGNFFACWENIFFSKRTLLHGVRCFDVLNRVVPSKLCIHGLKTLRIYDHNTQHYYSASKWYPSSQYSWAVCHISLSCSVSTLLTTLLRYCESHRHIVQILLELRTKFKQNMTNVESPGIRFYES
jgi:hypothetical protein